MLMLTTSFSWLQRILLRGLASGGRGVSNMTASWYSMTHSCLVFGSSSSSMSLSWASMP